MSKIPVEPYKGVRDFYPEDQAFLNYLFSTIRSFVEKVGYVEYHASVLEPAELYRGKTSEEIVNEQGYIFTDRGGREVMLRPEMTPTVARMVAAKRRELGFPLRLYSIPNVFRYERPQRGRVREHWQLNVDLFGSASPAADAEVIGVAYGLMTALGAKEDDFVIKVGSRTYLDEITQEYNLTEGEKTTLLGLLDRKAKMSENEFDEQLKVLNIPKERLSESEPPGDIAKMISDFKDSGIKNVVYAPEIVRGFNYYTGMVFEVFDTHPSNNRAVMGGGRYDNLLAMFGDERIPTVGFAMGDVTIRDFLEVRGLLPAYKPPTHVYLATPSPELAIKVQTLAAELRSYGVNVAIDFGERKLGDQIKNAAKHKIPYTIVVGEDELQNGEYKIKNLDTGEEIVAKKEEIAKHVKPSL
ncbi:MAG TPA: histidine--tRNA ligase [Candidatus Paceibacterota bacterium]|nr:histidine--tRNA ligase [Candidatus Paceibacterota bacterium]